MMASKITDTITLKAACNALSTVSYKWYKIGIQLGIPRHKLEEFKNEQDPLSAIIDCWLKGNIKDVKVNWATLVSILQTDHVDESGVAERVSKEHCTDYSHVENQDSSNASTYSSSDTSSGLPPVDLAAYFPNLRGKDFSDDELFYHRMELDRETTVIKSRFASMLLDLQKTAEKHQKIDDVVNTLRFHDKKFDSLLKDSKTIADVFGKASMYFSFFDLEIVKLLTNKCGTETSKKKLKNYKKKFQDYSKRRICECPSDAFGTAHESEKTYALKTEKNMDTFTVDELDKFRFGVNKILGTKSLRLLRVEEGCVRLVFRSMSDDLLKDISLDQQRELRSLGVLSISYGDETIDMTHLNISPNTASAKDTSSESGYLTGASHKSSSTGVSFEDTYDSIRRTPYQENDLINPRIDMMLSAESKQVVPDNPTEIYLASRYGDFERVKSLIKDGHNPLEVDMNGDTSLHVAAMYGHIDVLIYLIEDVGCNPATPGWNGTTPLHVSARQGLYEIVDYLIVKHHLEPNIQDNDGRTPLWFACTCGHFDIIRYLVKIICQYMKAENILEYYSKRLCSIVIETVCRCHLKVVKYFVSELKYDLRLCRDESDFGPLFYACRVGDIAMVKYLIEDCKCDPLRPVRQMLPLHYAGNHMEVVKYIIKHTKFQPGNDSIFPLLHLPCFMGYLDIVKYLIDEVNCNPLSVDDKGKSSLHWAASDGQTAILDYLIKSKKYNPNCQDQDGNWLTHASVSSGNIDTLRYLIEVAGINKDQSRLDGHSTLTLASFFGHFDIVRYLLSKNCAYYNKSHLTPLHAASRGGHINIVKFLMKRYPLSMHDKGGRSSVLPLHTATIGNHLNIVKYFSKECGCSPLLGDKFGSTILHYAAMLGHVEILRYLIECLKCDPLVKNISNLTPLKCCIQYAHLNVLRYYIIDLNINPETLDGDGFCPVHSAAAGGHLNIIKYLIEEIKCSIEVKTRGVLATPLLIASYHGQLNVARYLILDVKCDRLSRDSRGNTALHTAAVKNRLDVVKFLIEECNHHPLEKNYHDETPLQLSTTFSITSLYLIMKVYFL